MKKMARVLIPTILIMSIFNTATASSVKCSAKAASVYYLKLVKNDSVITYLRKEKAELSQIEINTINDLIYPCERGIEYKFLDTKRIRDSIYVEAIKIISEDAANAYADASIEMYNYGKSLNKHN